MMIDIDKIKVGNRIRKDYGNIEELAKDISENGLINPPVVSPEYELLAGERRYRAMKHLGLKQIEVRVMTVADALHRLKLEISENENRKPFSFSEKMQWAEMLKEEYTRIALQNSKAGTSVPNEAVEDGDDTSVPNGTGVGRVDERVAREVGIGGRSTLRRAEYVNEHATPEMIAMLDEGALSINAAYTKLKAEADAAKAELKNQRAQTESDLKEIGKTLEKQVLKNAELVEQVQTLKSKGDPELIAKIDKLEAENRKYYERMQKWQEEAERRQKMIDKIDIQREKNSSDMNELLDRVEQLEDELKRAEEAKRETDMLRQKLADMEAVGETQVAAQIESPYTMPTLLRSLSDFSENLAVYTKSDVLTVDETLGDRDKVDAYINQIFSCLQEIKNKMNRKGAAA